MMRGYSSGVRQPVQPPPGVAPRVRQGRIVVAHAPAPGPSTTSRCDRPHRRPENSAPARRRDWRRAARLRRSSRSRSRACAGWWRADRARSRRARAADLRHRRRRSVPSAWSARRAYRHPRRRDLEHLVAILERLGAVWREIPVGILRIGLDDDQVGPVAVAVGETPRDVAVAADDQHRQARQRHADQVARRFGASPRRSGVRDTRHAAAAGRDACRWRAALPCPAACVPATAQLLLPTNASSSSSTERCAAWTTPRCAQRPTRRSKMSAPGIGADRHLAARRSAHPTRCRADARKCEQRAAAGLRAAASAPALRCRWNRSG